METWIEGSYKNVCLRKAKFVMHDIRVSFNQQQEVEKSFQMMMTINW